MKKLIAIGLFASALQYVRADDSYFVFEDNYRTSSNVIIDDKWKIIKIPTTSRDAHYSSEDKEGLIRSGDDFYNIMHEYHENDTLYVILKSNQNAQERFSELTSLILGMTNPDADTPQNPLGKIIKLFGDLQKIYLSDEILLGLHEPIISLYNPSFYTEPHKSYYRVIHLLHSPPPELT